MTVQSQKMSPVRKAEGEGERRVAATGERASRSYPPLSRFASPTSPFAARARRHKA